MKTRQAARQASLESDASSITPTDLAHPRIAKVAVKTFKSLENIEFKVPEALGENDQKRLTAQALAINETGEIPQAPCLLILGENATGKSSILEAIALACLPKTVLEELNANGKTPILVPENLTLHPEYMGAIGAQQRKTSRVEVNFHGAPALVLTISVNKNTIAHTVASMVEKRSLPLIFAYGAHRLYGDDSDHTPVGRVETLFRTDRELPDPQPWLIELARTNLPALNEVVAALRHIIRIDGEFRDITVEKTPSGNERCVINIYKPRFGASSDASDEERMLVIPQRLDVVSSGYRAVLEPDSKLHQT